MADFKSNLKGNVLFQDLFSTRSRVFSAMTCIDNDYVYIELRISNIGAGGV